VVDERVVAIGLLTARDLEMLGRGFARCFPVPQDAAFEALLEQLAKVPPIGAPKADPEAS
jgi:hypothetical protein